MRIQYFSDIHLERIHKNPLSFLDREFHVHAPILIVAGDIGNPYETWYERFLYEMSIRFDVVFFTTGNHEYYHHGHPMDATDNHLHALCARYPNVTYLQRSFKDYGGYRFAGTTLWSHLSDAKYLTHDVHSIQGFSMGQFNAYHERSKFFIQDILDTSPLPIVMVTHYLPSHGLVDPVYANDPDAKRYQQCYSSSCDSYMRSPIRVWIYGHTHRPSTHEMYGLSTFCNPIGYPGENPVTDFNRVFEIPSVIS